MACVSGGLFQLKNVLWNELRQYFHIKFYFYILGLLWTSFFKQKGRIVVIYSAVLKYVSRWSLPTLFLNWIAQSDIEISGL